MFGRARSNVLPIAAAVSVHMVQQANPNVFFALLLKPIKFTAKESPDYRAAKSPPPLPSLPLLCLLMCSFLYACHQGQCCELIRWECDILVHVSVCLLIHMGAALIKSSGSTIHTTGCLAPSGKKKSFGVLSGSMTKAAGSVYGEVL